MNGELFYNHPHPHHFINSPPWRSGVLLRGECLYNCHHSEERLWRCEDLILSLFFLHHLEYEIATSSNQSIVGFFAMTDKSMYFHPQMVL